MCRRELKAESSKEENKENIHGLSAFSFHLSALHYFRKKK
jgi:hypothetical protein